MTTLTPTQSRAFSSSQAKKRAIKTPHTVCETHFHHQTVQYLNTKRNVHTMHSSESLQNGDHRSKQGMRTTGSRNYHVQDKQVLWKAISPQDTITFINLLKTSNPHHAHFTVVPHRVLRLGKQMGLRCIQKHS